MKTLLIFGTALLISTPAMALDHSKDRVWAALIQDMEAHNAQFQRFCHPEASLCEMFAGPRFYHNKMMILRTVSDFNDYVIKREVCEENQMMDIRICTDLDTGQVRNDMRDSNTGKWTLGVR